MFTALLSNPSFRLSRRQVTQFRPQAIEIIESLGVVKQRNQNAAQNITQQNHMVTTGDRRLLMVVLSKSRYDWGLGAANVHKKRHAKVPQKLAMQP
jgi:hypothetical protein